MKLCDGGSTYSKILDTASGELAIMPTKDLIKERDRWFAYATGHSSRHWCDRYVNELIALAEGARELVDAADFTVLDIGGRDTKYVTFRAGEPVNLNWNPSCGGNVGFTVEILGRYYDIDYGSLAPAAEWVPVACGLLGVERVFDEINRGLDPGEGVARFLHGLARSTHQFCGEPERVYLSGGFALNACFVQTFARYCEVRLLGRDALIRGLLRIARGEGKPAQPSSDHQAQSSSRHEVE